MAQAIQMECRGHEELRDLVVETKTEVKNLNLQMERFLGAFEKRVASVDSRLECLEHEAIEQRTTIRNIIRTASALAGVVSFIGIGVGILATVFWSR